MRRNIFLVTLFAACVPVRTAVQTAPHSTPAPVSAPVTPAPALAAPAPLPVVHVAVDHSRSLHGLPVAVDAFVAAAFPALRVTGYEFTLVPSTEPHELQFTRLSVRNCSGHIAYWFTETSSIAVAPECVHGAAEWTWMVLHETAHGFGARHLCHHVGELPDAKHAGEHCDPGAIGRAVMNPYVSYDDEPVPTAYTALDLAELARARAAGH